MPPRPTDLVAILLSLLVAACGAGAVVLHATEGPTREAYSALGDSLIGIALTVLGILLSAAFWGHVRAGAVLITGVRLWVRARLLLILWVGLSLGYAGLGVSQWMSGEHGQALVRAALAFWWLLLAVLPGSQVRATGIILGFWWLRWERIISYSLALSADGRDLTLKLVARSWWARRGQAFRARFSVSQGDALARLLAQQTVGRAP